MGASISQFFRPTPNALLQPAHPHTEAPQASESGQPLSKNARKKQAREERLRERKQARKAERRALKARKKIEKRSEREQRLRQLPEAERQRVVEERVRIMRAGRAEERAHKAHVREVLTSGTRFNVCVDLGWNDAMYDKERKSLARQLAYSYSALRKSVDDGLTPVRLSICGIDEVIKPMLTFVAHGWETWPVGLSDKPLEQAHDTGRLVYLTHDAEHVLETLHPDDIYVIGGIVDRNRLKCATIDKANALGIRTAKLNLDANISLQHGSPVLTVNHCVEILISAANGMSWKDAYLKVLPLRKGIISNIDVP